MSACQLSNCHRGAVGNVRFEVKADITFSARTVQSLGQELVGLTAAFVLSRAGVHCGPMQPPSEC
jgi:hypothetical protein